MEIIFLITLSLRKKKSKMLWWDFPIWLKQVCQKPICKNYEFYMTRINEIEFKLILMTPVYYYKHELMYYGVLLSDIIKVYR